VITVNIRQFDPNEHQLTADASSLGLPPGASPDFVKVVDDAGRDADYKLIDLVIMNGEIQHWELKLTGYSQPLALIPNPDEGASMWTPRFMVIIND
jgi:hypothetical protein